MNLPSAIIILLPQQLTMVSADHSMRWDVTYLLWVWQISDNLYCYEIVLSSLIKQITSTGISYSTN